MEENKIPTIEEFIMKEFGLTHVPGKLDIYDVKHIAVGFAKMHLKAQQEALKARRFILSTYTGTEEVISVDMVETCYLIDNIK